MKLEGHTAVVTGGARGIGLAITKKLLQNKVKVYFLDVDITEGKSVQQHLDKEYGKGLAIFYSCDVTNAEQFKDILTKIAEENGSLDILCNNAGIGPTDDFQKLIDVNLTGTINGTKSAIDLMDTNKGGKGGNVINISSVAGLAFIPTPEPSYTASKHGIVGFTRSMAQSAIKMGVRLNCICPSTVDTRMLRETFKNAELKEIASSLGTAIQSTDIVAKGFLQLLEDEEKVGEAMRITSQKGIDYHSFSPEPIPY